MKSGIGLSFACAALGLAAVAADWPTDYVKVEYIESTASVQYLDGVGGPYIDTGVQASKTLCAEMDFVPLEYTGKVSLGTDTDSQDPGTQWRFFNYGTGVEGFIFDIAATRLGRKVGDKLTLGERYQVSVGCTNEMAYIDVTGATLTRSYTGAFSGTLDTSRNVRACASAMRLYSLKLFEQEGGSKKLIRDFVPCVRVSDGVAGFIDKVEGRFYTNAGPGQLRTVGGLPAGYVPLEYIESTAGGGQYIDTGYVPTKDTCIVADIHTMTRSQDWAVFFGVTGGDRSSDGVLLRYRFDDINAWFCNSDLAQSLIGGLQNTRITVELKSGGMTLNGQSAAITTTGTPYSGPIYLFCGNNGGSAWRHQAMRLYSFKIYEGNDLERDFVPCLHVSSGAAGLFEKVGEYFYAEAGGTGFVHPAVDIPPIDDLPRVGFSYLIRGKKGLEQAEMPDGGYTPLTSRTHDLEDGKWYAVFGDVTVKGGLVAHGKAHLILGDGASLTVADVPAGRAAIAVEAGDELTICGQEKMTGLLTASGGAHAAGIGSGGDRTCGTIVIDGGTIMATGGTASEGIGSGRWGEPGPVDIHPDCADRVTSMRGPDDSALANAADFDGVLVVGDKVRRNTTADAVFKVTDTERTVRLTTDAEGRFAAKIPGLSGAATSVELVEIDGKDVTGNRIMRLPRTSYALVAAAADTVISDEELAVADGEITASGDLTAGESIQVNGTVDVATDAVSVSKAAPADTTNLCGVRIVNGGKIRWIGSAEQLFSGSLYAKMKNGLTGSAWHWCACLDKDDSVPLSGRKYDENFYTSTSRYPCKVNHFSMRFCDSDGESYPPADPATDESRFNKIAKDNVFEMPCDGFCGVRLHTHYSCGGTALTLKVEDADGGLRNIINPGWVQVPTGFAFRHPDLDRTYTFAVQKGDKVHLRVLFSEKPSNFESFDTDFSLDVSVSFRGFGTKKEEQK